MAKCLVTGGAGFIGSHIVDGLIEKGHQIRVFDNLSTGKKENLAEAGSQIELVVDDLRNRKALEKACEGIDYVFHVAALRAVSRSVDEPSETNDVNVTGTLNLLLAAREKAVKRVVFSSSSSIYGETEKFPSNETDLPKPESPYAASKIMGEYYCQIFTSLYDLETVSLRYFNVFGPRQNPESKYSTVIPIFVDCLLKGISPEIHWDGHQTRDFHYVDSVVQANLSAMSVKNVSGQVFNIGSSEEYSIFQVFENLKRILNIKDIEPIFKPKREGDVRRTLADTSEAKRLLNFKLQTRFETGLEKTVKWFLEAGIFSPHPFKK